MKSLKKLALVVLTLAVLLTCFTSCEQIEKIPGLENILDMLPGAEDEHVHAFGEATCTAPATCECGATEGDPLGHSFADGKCACGAEDPNYVPPHTHTFVDGVCECGESDPDYIPPHTHNFVDGVCECGQDGPVALGHIDEDGNDFCDRCEFNLKLDIETITTKYNNVKDTDKVDTTNGVATFDGVNVTATFTKGSASLNTNGTDHMRLNKGNVLTVTSNNGKNIVGITLVASSSSYVDELGLYCQALGYEYTVDGNEITFTVEACTVLELANSSSKAQRIASVKVIYEK